MEKGDRFIFYGKNNVVNGTIKDFFEKITYDINNGVKVKYIYIISDKDEIFNSNSCLKIESEIGPNILRKLLKLLHF